MSLFTKIAMFLWSRFAPEKVKVEVESIMKEFVSAILWILFFVFILAISFFTGTYYLGAAIHQSIDSGFLSYLLSTVCLFFLTLFTAIILLRFLIRRAINRVMHKGNQMVSSFSKKKV